MCSNHVHKATTSVAVPYLSVSLKPLTSVISRAITFASSSSVVASFKVVLLENASTSCSSPSTIVAA